MLSLCFFVFFVVGKIAMKSDILVQNVYDSYNPYLFEQITDRAITLAKEKGYDYDGWIVHSDTWKEWMHSEGWLLREGKDIVGMAIFCRMYDKHCGEYDLEPNWQLSRVYIDKVWRRKGCASKRIASWLEHYGSPLYLCQPNVEFKALLRKLHYRLRKIGLDKEHPNYYICARKVKQ